MATSTLSAQHHDPCLHLHSYDLLQVDTGSLNIAHKAGPSWPFHPITIQRCLLLVVLPGLT